MMEINQIKNELLNVLIVDYNTIPLILKGCNPSNAELIDKDSNVKIINFQNSTHFKGGNYKDLILDVDGETLIITLKVNEESSYKYIVKQINCR